MRLVKTPFGKAVMGRVDQCSPAEQSGDTVREKLREAEQPRRNMKVTDGLTKSSSAHNSTWPLCGAKCCFGRSVKKLPFKRIVKMAGV